DCDIAIGAWGERTRGKRWLISDNVLLGNKRWSMGIEWGTNNDVVGLRGVVVTGDGHVIQHNYIEGFRDGVGLGNVDHHETEGPDYAPNTSIDICYNEVVSCLDIAFKLDWARSNVRCFENRATNSRSGLTGSPVFGGPLYAIRNALVNQRFIG